MFPDLDRSNPSVKAERSANEKSHATERQAHACAVVHGCVVCGRLAEIVLISDT
eukprot:COSAG06_NODE_15134_length_1095_cov_1.474900_2_plen_53_part_01